MGKKHFHVMRHGDGWSVSRSIDRPRKPVYATQHAAVRDARRRAASEHTDVLIHGRDGRIRESLSFDTSVGMRDIRPAPVSANVTLAKIRRTARKHKRT